MMVEIGMSCLVEGTPVRTAASSAGGSGDTCNKSPTRSLRCRCGLRRIASSSSSLSTSGRWMGGGAWLVFRTSSMSFLMASASFLFALASCASLRKTGIRLDLSELRRERPGFGATLALPPGLLLSSCSLSLHVRHSVQIALFRSGRPLSVGRPPRSSSNFGFVRIAAVLPAVFFAVCSENATTRLSGR